MNVVNTRIAQRFDTLAGWQQQDPILLDGELAVISTDNQIRFKVGDGQHKFTELQYIDYFKITTLSAFANVLSGNSLAVGFENEAAAHSIAVGSNVSAKAQHSIALGNHAATSSLDSFVFNGDNGYNVDAYYDHGIGTFNVNAPLSNIYIQQSAFSDILSEKAESSALNKKITILDAISNLCAQTDISIVKLSADDYAQLVATSSTVSNCLYIVEDDIINACGQQISNLAPGTGLSDAVNLEQLSNAISSIQIPTDLSAFTNSPGYLSSIETVAPTSSDSGKGKAADAKATGVALYSGFTEWEFSDVPQGYSVKAVGNIRVPQGTRWVVSFNETTYVAAADQFNASDAMRLTFTMSGGSFSGMTATRHLVTPTKTSQLSNDSGFLSAIPNTYALKSDIQMSYHQNEHKIVLSSGTNTTSVDCSDFIKDGMLSAAELCGTQLVLTFNTDAGSQPISIELSNFIDDYDSSIQSISDAVDAKITIDDQISGICAQTDLSIVKLSADDYAFLVATSATLSNCLYIVEDDIINACGQQISNLAPGTSLSDAVNLEQLSDAVNSIQIPTDLSAFTNSPGYLVSNDISDYYKKSETSSSSQISNELKKYQLSGNYLSANALANYYTKSETSSASEIQTALENAGGSGSNVQVSADYQTGTRIATVSVDDVPTEIYVPSANSSSRYALVTAQLVSDNGLLTCAVNDQTITTIQVSSSSTPIVVQLPVQPADGARDFILRIEISSSAAPTFTFNGVNETIDFDSEDDDWAVMEPGLNLVSFTETKRGN